MNGEQRLLHGVLAVGGSLLVHALVYAAFTAGGGVSGHGNTDGILAIAFSGVLAIAALAVGRAALRRGGCGRVRLVPLMLSQVGLFAGQELFEGLGSGAGLLSTVGAPTFVVGLALQPLVAWMLTALVRGAQRFGDSLAIVGATPRGMGGGLVWSPAVVPTFVSPDVSPRRRTRAPPG